MFKSYFTSSILRRILAICFIDLFLFLQYFHQNNIYSLQLVVAYTGLVYRKVSMTKNKITEYMRFVCLSKVLRLSSRSMNTMTSGEITNLLSNDVKRVQLAMFFFNYLWESIEKSSS